jgi:hypothetical protein
MTAVGITPSSCRYDARKFQLSSREKCDETSIPWCELVARETEEIRRHTAVTKGHQMALESIQTCLLRGRSNTKNF